MLRSILAVAFSIAWIVSAIAQTGLLSGAAGPGRSVLDPSIEAYQFINLMKTCTSLRSAGSAWAFPSGLDANGYPTANLPIGMACGANSPFFEEYSGPYVITWSGSLGATAGAASFSLKAGTVSVVTDCSPTCIASNSGTTVTMRGSNGYVVLQPSGPLSQCCSVTFPAGVTDTTVKDIAMYRKDQESWQGTASISGATLTRATTATGTIQKGDFVYSNGVAPGTRVTAILGGGLYTVNISQTIATGLMSSAQTFNPDYLSMARTLNPAILRVGLGYGSPNVQTQSRDSYTPQLSSMMWSGAFTWPVGSWVGGQGAAGTISSGRAGALDCGAGATTAINYCAPLPTDSGASTYVDGETVTGYVVNSTSPFSVTVTGSISGTTLTTTSGTVDGLRGVTCTSCAPGTVITGGSGTTWTVNISQTVASQSMFLVPTLKVGNKDPVSISGSLSGRCCGSISGNASFLFVYDDVQKLWLTPSAQNQGQAVYVPVEIQSELCNLIGAGC